MKQIITSICMLMLASACCCGCRTVDVGPTRHMLANDKGKVGPEIPVPKMREDSLRSSNYRFTTTLPKKEVDKIIAAMEQYHLQIYLAIKPNWNRPPEHVDVFIPDSKEAFQQIIQGEEQLILDPDFVAVVPASRRIIVLYESKWKEFSKRLFRSQARMFFRDCMPDLPLWLREGLAFFFEEVTIGGKGAETTFKIVGYDSKKLAIVQALIKDNEFPSLNRLIAISDRNKLTDIDRVTAWAFVYWSQHSGRPSRETFKAYMKALINSTEQKVNIEDHLRMPLETFEKRWKTWLSRQEVYLQGKPEKSSERKK